MSVQIHKWVLRHLITSLRMKGWEIKMNYSFSKVNYFLRPKKQIERKLFIEHFTKFIGISKTLGLDFENYRYIGMGSVFYYDFILFHKYLHINRMTSIDSANTIKRFKYNRPYDFITFVNKSVQAFLKTYNFKKENFIMWLDYDYKLYNITDKFYRTGILEDIKKILENGKFGDFFIITIENKYPKTIKDRKNFYMEFKELLSLEFNDEEKMVNEKFMEKNIHLITDDIVTNFIDINQKFNEVKLQKICSFIYRDGAPMYTYFGVFDNASEQKIVSTFGEHRLTADKKIVNIDVPILTYKEKLYLDSIVTDLLNKVKVSTTKASQQKILNELEFEVENFDILLNYLDFYKYYPQYYEGII